MNPIMGAKPQRPKDQEDAISVLDAAIEALSFTEKSSIPPAKVVFGSVSILLTTIRVCLLLFSDDLL